MAVIVPFRGISYNPQMIRDLSKVVAPPYDVISPREQDALYQRHPQNVVLLILNKQSVHIIKPVPEVPVFKGSYNELKCPACRIGIYIH